jgi:hypothetical protein
MESHPVQSTAREIDLAQTVSDLSLIFLICPGLLVKQRRKDPVKIWAKAKRGGCQLFLQWVEVCCIGCPLHSAANEGWVIFLQMLRASSQGELPTSLLALMCSGSDLD